MQEIFGQNHKQKQVLKSIFIYKNFSKCIFILILNFCRTSRKSFQFASYPVITSIDSIQVCFINLAGFKNQVIIFLISEMFVNVEENFETHTYMEKQMLFFRSFYTFFSIIFFIKN